MRRDSKSRRVSRRRPWGLALIALAGTAWGQDVTTPAGTGRAVPMQPGGQPQGQPAALPQVPAPGEDEIELSAFAEPLDIKMFVEYVAEALSINVIGNETLSGNIVLNAPVRVKRSELLPLLDSLLEQYGFTVTRDATGFYRVVASGQVPLSPGGDRATTRLIATPGLRPSGLELMIRSQLGTEGATRLSFLDDLGVIVVTDTPRRIGALERLIGEVLSRRSELRLLRFELEHIAAPVARQRVIELLGQATASAAFPGQPGGAPGSELLQVAGGGGGRLTNLSERLTADAQGNALIFRGAPDEVGLVEAVLAVIDVPNVLETRQYYAGRAARAIADVARSRGLGEVQQIQTKGAASAEAGLAPGMQLGQFQGINPLTGQPATASTSAGPTLVVDVSRGVIIYSGTAAQHEQMAALITEFDTEQDLVVIREYKLNDAKATDVADLITGLLQNQAVATETGSLLPQQQGLIQGLRRSAQPTPGGSGQAGAEGVSFAADEDVFVLADEANNQVLVKAPAKLQAQFEELIRRLDLRRAQVYIEAKIVSVTATDELRLAFEYQLINAGGAGGAFNTNFGLGSFGETGRFNDPKRVNTGLSGFTAALIRSDHVPVIINALQRNVDARVLSTPQLLVDDNEVAEIASVEVQQTLVTTQTTGNPTQTSVGQPQEAGTTLRVTPHISRGGYVRLEYNIEQSQFLGRSQNGIPADQQRNTISSDSVTVPGDTTVVIGGLTVSSVADTIVKIPLLGDIPILGFLFRDTNKSDRQTRLYIFLTPRILQEPTVRDLALLTRGPQAEAGLAEQIPVLRPTVIEIVESAAPGAR